MRLLTALLLPLLAAPAFAQGESDPGDISEPMPIHAAGWCVIVDNKDESAPKPAKPAKGQPVEDDDLGCDAGAGVRLFTSKRFPRLSIVAALGSETLGGGLAYRIGKVGKNPIAIAAGAVVRYDLSTGIDASEVYPVLGATLSFSRRVGN